MYMCIHGVYIYIFTYTYMYRTLYPLQPCVRCSFWVIGRLVVRPCRRLNCPLSRSACWWKQLINHFILSGISTDAAIEDMLFFSIKWYQIVRSRQKIFTWLPEALGRGKLAEGSRPGHALESHGGIIDSGWEGFLSSSSQTRQNPSMFFKNPWSVTWDWNETALDDSKMCFPCRFSFFKVALHLGCCILQDS